MKNLSLLLLLFLATTSHQVVNRKIRNILSSEDNSESYRLPNNSIPYHYKINFSPHIIPDNFTFNGELEVYLQIVEPTKNLTLHATNLTILDEETTIRGDKGTISPDKHIIDKKRDFLILTFSNELLPGNYTLQLKFNGTIGDKDLGLFKNSYKNDRNETEYLISTLFQPTFAREAFPCWDEPALKATFDISVKHFPNYTVLSNMPMEKIREDNDGKIWTDFKTTPVMSTYLVTFLISNLKNHTNAEGNFSIWSAGNPVDTMSNVLETGQKAIKFLEKYTGISYSLPKQDHAMIPRVSTAIENWGLITYKKDIGFQTLETCSTQTTIDAKLLVIHEICHQWFGNLVTPEWWDHLWLSEGFAQYIQWIIASQTMDEPRLIEVFVATNKYDAYNAERYSSVLALTPELKTTKDVNRAFEDVTYLKGAAVILMIRNIISEKVFDAGVRKYLQKHQFKTVNPDDLWKSLSEALIEEDSKNNIDIKKIMNPYLKQRGYPVINVVRNYNTGTVKISQECLVCAKLYNNTDSEEPKWWIPINFVTNSSLDFASTAPTYWLNPEEKDLIIDGIDSNDWIIVNVKNTGHYRVNYDMNNWYKIVDYLKSDNYTKIHVLNRLQLIEDAYYFLKNGKISFTAFLDIFSYLHQEVDYIPWIAGFRILNEFDKYNDNYISKLSMKIFATSMFIQNLLNRIGLEEKENDELFTRLQRRELLKISCNYEVKSCETRAREQLSKVLNNSNLDSISANDKDWILCAGMKKSNETIWNSMLDVYKETEDENVLESLSCHPDEKILTKYLNLIIEDNNLISGTKVQNVLRFVSKNNIDLTLEFIKSNRKEIERKLNNELTMISVYQDITDYSRNLKDLEKIRNFLEKNEDQETNEAIKSMLSMKKEEIEAKSMF